MSFYIKLYGNKSESSGGCAIFTAGFEFSQAFMSVAICWSIAGLPLGTQADRGGGGAVLLPELFLHIPLKYHGALPTLSDT